MLNGHVPSAELSAASEDQETDSHAEAPAGPAGSLERDGAAEGPSPGRSQSLRWPKSVPA